MKKLFTISLLLLTMMVQAQNNFFTPTTYRGAIDPDSTKDWTRGWSNWTPTTTSYPTATVNVNAGNITTNTTWTKNNIYLLNDGYVYITNNATLTIEPGTVIRGTGKGTLIICRGAKIYAKGTASEPIVFTSNNGAGLRAPGDWGGVVLTGRATHNLPQGDTAAAEGGIAKPVTGSGEIDGRFGGNNDDDSTGVMEYVRIEFAGIPLTTASNSEINGLTFYAVGRKTKIENIMVAYSGDDSYEWFGGTVNCKKLIAYAGIDDDFDTDNGFRGLVQFGLGVRIAANADQSGSNGFESDNDANGSSNTPRTAPVFSNMTILGPLFTGQTATVNSNFQRAAHIRRNSALTCVNSILAGYPSAGLLVDSRKTNNNFQSGTAVFKNNIVAGIPGGYAGRLASNSDTIAIATSSAVAAWMVTNSNDTFATSNEVNLVRPYTYSNPNYAPASGSIALTNVNFNTGKTPFDARPVAGFTYVQDTASGSKKFVFTNTSETKTLPTTYLWIFGSSDTSTAINPTFTFAANGTYTVTLIARNSISVDTISKIITVLASGISNAAQDIEQLEVYPNPVRETLNLSFNLTRQEEVAVLVSNLNGETVLEMPATDMQSGTVSMSTSIVGLNEGLYFVTIKGATATQTRKIVVLK